MTDQYKRGDRVRIINDRELSGICCTVLEAQDDGKCLLLIDRDARYADTGEPLAYCYIDRDAGPWRADRLVRIHPKKPNKIVIPDGPAPEWAVSRAKDLFKYKQTDFWCDIGHLIAMLEEEPIDEDLIEARKICAEAKAEFSSVGVDFMDGSQDKGFCMRAVLDAIKRGRELGKAGDQDHD